MASTNFKLFDENKVNMMSDTEYNINTQRLNGVQAGIASSRLQNKTLYQTSLMSYALAQLMNQNGIDASDTSSVSSFVGNLGSALLQKVADLASVDEAKSGSDVSKWMSPKLVKLAIESLSGVASYPVGSIYISVNNTNPGEIFGGTWEQLKDTFLLAAGDKYAAGTTGGEEKHTLTVSEIPSHNHNSSGAVFDRSGTSIHGGYGSGSGNDTRTGYAGGSQAHNNMPPYTAVYVWKRIA